MRSGTASRSAFPDPPILIYLGYDWGDLPGGFEYSLAEIGSSSFQTRGPITLSHDDRYAQFAHLHMNNQGVVRGAAA